MFEEAYRILKEYWVLWAFLIVISLCLIRGLSVSNFRTWIEEKMDATASVDSNGYAHYVSSYDRANKIVMDEPGHTCQAMFFEFWRPLTISEWFDQDPTK